MSATVETNVFSLSLKLSQTEKNSMSPLLLTGMRKLVIFILLTSPNKAPTMTVANANTI